MADLQKSINVSEPNRPLYQIWVNDGTSDGGQNGSFLIFVEAKASFSSENIEDAVQAFADSLSSVPNATLLNAIKITAVETPL